MITKTLIYTLVGILIGIILANVYGADESWSIYVATLRGIADPCLSALKRWKAALRSRLHLPR